MRISLVTPVQPEFWTGNRVTAERWSNILRELGHDVRLGSLRPDATSDLLIALHATKSADAIRRFSAAYPQRPIIVALTGTDIYRDLPGDEEALETLKLATRIVSLQPAATEALPPVLHDRVRVIYQSVASPTRTEPVDSAQFQVCVIGNLREEKDPFLIAEAVKSLPASSSIKAIHIGGAYLDEMERRATTETQDNPRYEWIGPLSRERTLLRIAVSGAMALTSKMEGGANVLSEAIVCGVPIVASRISGTVGILGDAYAGYFTAGNAQELANLLSRLENEPSFPAALLAQTEPLMARFDPATERHAWQTLLQELN